MDYDRSFGGVVTLRLVHVSSQQNVPIETFNISFESTQNMQPYGTKITCTEVKKKVMAITNIATPIATTFSSFDL